jgi:hypothetical protein
MTSSNDITSSKWYINQRTMLVQSFFSQSFLRAHNAWLGTRRRHAMAYSSRTDHPHPMKYQLYNIQHHSVST